MASKDSLRPGALVKPPLRNMKESYRSSPELNNGLSFRRIKLAAVTISLRNPHCSLPTLCGAGLVLAT